MIVYLISAKWSNSLLMWVKCPSFTIYSYLCSLK